MYSLGNFQRRHNRSNTEPGAIYPDVPKLLSLQELSIDIRFPDLGMKEKNAGKRVASQ